MGCINCEKTVELETKFQSKNIGPCQLFQNSSVIHLWILIIRVWGCFYVSHGRKQVTKTRSPRSTLEFLKGSEAGWLHRWLADRELRKVGESHGVTKAGMCQLEKTVMGQRW